jgi:hypothetical protein
VVTLTDQHPTAIIVLNANSNEADVAVEAIKNFWRPCHVRGRLTPLYGRLTLYLRPFGVIPPGHEKGIKNSSSYKLFNGIFPN